MLQNNSREVSDCLRRAEQCKRLAQSADTEAGAVNYLDMARRWLSLARSHEFAERLSNFVEPFRKRRQQKV